ncbi:MAG: hypothetical protein AAFY99_07780 [Pseudomonadota bacterium]
MLDKAISNRRILPRLSMFFTLVCCFACPPSMAFAQADFGPLNTSIIAENTKLLEKPLFSPSRRPPLAPIVATTPEVTVPQPERLELLPSWTLTGVLVTEGEVVAIVRNTEAEQTYRFSVGESRDGWKLNLVDERSAVFSNGDKSIRVIYGNPPQEL